MQKLDLNIQIEASAGTGKTYTLERLVARLICEYNVALEQIVVLTFTDKAAAELSHRIRQHLISLNQEKGDPRLQRAVEQFSQAQISTFHSFIYRLLRQAPIQTGVPPQLQLEQQGYKDLYLQCLHRVLLQPHEQQFSGDYLAFCRTVGSSNYEKIVATLSEGYYADFLQGHTDLVLYPGEQQLSDFQKLDLNSTATGNCQEFAALDWPTRLFNFKTNGGIRVLRANDRDISIAAVQAFFSSLGRCRNLAELFAYLDNRCSKAVGWQLLPLLSSQHLESQNETAKIRQWREYHRVELVDRLLEPIDFLFDHNCNQDALKVSRFLHYLRRGIKDRLALLANERGVLSFDALIDLLHQRLCCQEPDQQLLHYLQRRFRIGLIDEFQDTDRRQWAIVRAIFSHRRRQCPGNLIVVGDPKQSIYGFRGVNPYTYSLARREIDRNYVLSVNYRSSSDLIAACNNLFSRLWPASGDNSRPQFRPVTCSEQNNCQLVHAGKVEAACSLVDLDCQAPGKLRIAELRRNYYDWICGKIGALLSGDYYWRVAADTVNRRLQPSDIAVLFDTNQSCEEMRQQLARQGIPVTVGRQQNIFSTFAAELLQIWFQLLDEPREQNNWRLLLLTLPYQLQPPSIVVLLAAAEILDFLFTAVEYWQHLVARGRVDQALQSFFSLGEKLAPLASRMLSEQQLLWLQQSLPQALRRQHDGDRHLTDLQQLSEWLVEIQFNSHLDAQGLRQRLAQAATGELPQQLQQRLDSESNTVRLLTAHAAKGLQFPLVFIAVGLKGSFAENKRPRYHSSVGQVQMLCPSTKAQQQQQQEEAAEFRRLFYVSLTRSRYKIFLPFSGCCNWGYPLVSLLVEFFPATVNNQIAEWQPGSSRFLHQLTAIKTVMQAAGLLRREFDNLQQQFPRQFQVDAGSPVAFPAAGWQNAAGGGQVLQPARKFQLQYDRKKLPCSSSFTALCHGKEQLLNHRESDAVSDEELLAGGISDNNEPFDRQSLSGGALLGDLLHVLFEQIDFTIADQPWEQFAAIEQVQKLIIDRAGERFSPSWGERALTVISSIIWHTLQSPLAPAGLRLCQLQPQQRRHELEFLLNISACHHSLQLGDFNYQLSPGLMHGFIDLVFRWQGKIYLLDWKSNQPPLDAAADWDDASLDTLMTRNNYRLQYYIYLSALWKKIGGGEESYRRQFGGCYYLFLRAINATIPGRGVFFAQPDWEDLQRFSHPFGC